MTCTLASLPLVVAFILTSLPALICSTAALVTPMWFTFSYDSRGAAVSGNNGILNSMFCTLDPGSGQSLCINRTTPFDSLLVQKVCMIGGIICVAMTVLLTSNHLPGQENFLARFAPLVTAALSMLLLIVVVVLMFTDRAIFDEVATDEIKLGYSFWLGFTGAASMLFAFIALAFDIWMKINACTTTL